MDCVIWFEKFDSTELKMPIMCLPCCHCFCGKCVARLHNCPMCTMQIKEKRPNYGLLAFLAERHKKYDAMEADEKSRYADLLG